ncbi:MAG: RNA-binding protein [Gammaproteobacteria bacterium]|nr:RNA-binding protein [Gammaproteobacteria bacterium]MCK5090978.1 RNA-binding protein [Gammaproteobacteria bacterium]
MKLLIRNLARTTTEAEIRAMFEVYGAVQSCTLVKDKETGSSKGFGFIEMPSPGDARVAVKRLNGEDVAGNKIRVKKAEPAAGKGKSAGSDSDE